MTGVLVFFMLCDWVCQFVLIDIECWRYQGHSETLGNGFPLNREWEVSTSTDFLEDLDLVDEGWAPVPEETSQHSDAGGRKSLNDVTIWLVDLATFAELMLIFFLMLSLLLLN